MERRKRPTVDLLALIKIAVVLGLAWVGASSLSTHIGPIGVLILLLIAAGILSKVILPWRRRESLILKVSHLVDGHTEALAKRRAQLVRSDSYGRILLEKWHDEIDYFMTHHIHPALTAAERRVVVEDARSREYIIARIERVATMRPAFSEFTKVSTPSEFEAFCAEQLRLNGWRAHVTSQSRDQGVDVIAERQGIRVVLQCKMYSNPVGNKAVQEAVAAREHERAAHGVVVTNNRYTSAAEQLAATNRILLLHYSELPRLYDVLTQSSVA